MRLKKVSLICCATLMVGALGGCAKTEEPLLDSRIVVEVQEAKTGSLSLEGKYIGTVSAAETVEVVPIVSGVVKSVDVEVGQVVEAGQKLCQLDDSSARISLESARASYQSAVTSAGSSTGSAWNLSSEQENNQIESLEGSLADISDQIDSYEDQKSDLKDEKDKASDNMNRLKAEYEDAAAAYEAAVQAASVTETPADQIKEEPAEGESSETSADQSVDLPAESSGQNAELDALKAQMETKKAAYEQAAASFESINASYQSSKATLNSTIDSLESQKNSLEGDIAHAKEIRDINNSQVYQDKMAAANNSIESARINVESAEYQVGLYEIQSPIAGVVDLVNVSENNFASASSVAFSIAADNEKVVTWYVTEDVRDELSIGQDITVEYNGKNFSGNISEIGTAVDLEKGLFKVKAVLYGMENLSNGIRVEISFAAHTVSDKIIVPFDAVYYENGEPYVYVAEDGLAVRYSVIQGISDENSVVIEEGLTEGQSVITSWSANLADGAEVLVKEETEETE